MDFKKTLLFGALLAGLLTYIYKVEVPKQTEELTKTSIVKDLTQEELEKITITRDGQVFELVNTNPHKPKKHDPAEDVSDSNDEIVGKDQASTDWKLSDIPAADLDPGKVNALASAIITLTSSASVPEHEVEKDLSLYGLDKPALELSFTGKGKGMKLSYGVRNEFAGDRYLKVEGRPELFLVNDTLFEAANKAKIDFRDKTPVVFSDDSVLGIEVASKDSRVSIVPNEKKEWRIVEPFKATAATGAVYDLFRNLRNFQAAEFLDTPQDLKEYGLDAPLVTVTVKRKEGDKIVEIARANEKSYVRIDKTGPVYVAANDLTVSVRSDASVYRDRMLMKFDTYYAHEVILEKADGTKLALKKSGAEEWKVNAKDADAPFVRQYLKDLSDVKAVSFPEAGADLGFAHPTLKVTVRSIQDGKSSDKVLLVGAKNNGGMFAAVGDGSEPFVISDDSYRSLNAAEERFLPAQP